MIYRYNGIFQHDINNVLATGFSLNLCNDTILLCNEKKNDNEYHPELNFDSSLIYRDQKGICKKLTGSFYKSEEKGAKNYLIYQNEKQIIYEAPKGDKCSDDNYRTTFFLNNIKNTSIIPKIEWNKIKIPNIMNEGICDYKIDINIDFDESIEHLLVQKFFNDYWILTGILFLIIGFYLMFMAQNKKATKFVIGIILGEIIVFTIACGFFSIKNMNMEWYIFPVGLVFGGFLGYFSLGGNKLFKSILSITAGFIFGLVSFDIIFLHQNYQLAEVLLTDSILIFAGFFFIFIYLLPEYHYYCDSVIGSYIFMRGISILLHKLGKYARYRELQLMLYLINAYEFDYAKHYFHEEWPIYFVYDIFIVLFMIVSMFYYYTKAVGKDEDDDEEEKEDKNKEEKLIGNKKTTITEDDDILE